MVLEQLHVHILKKKERKKWKGGKRQKERGGTSHYPPYLVAYSKLKIDHRPKYKP